MKTKTPSFVNPQDVFVLYSTGQPAMPCTQERARELMEKKRARIAKYHPFTIILDRKTGENQPVEVKFDPGSKTTGIAVVANDKLLFGANLKHRGQEIVAALLERSQYRRGRRARKTRYREARFLNRKNRVGKLPPSVQSRIDNVKEWFDKIAKICPVTSIACETMKFDTQLMQDPNISGAQYQHGTLYGFTVKEYLLAKYNHTCVYCEKKDKILEVEHVIAKSQGGSDRISNLVIACVNCNTRKGTTAVQKFVKDKKKLTKILDGMKKPLRDAAVMNSIRIKIGEMLTSFGIPVTFGDGALTKFNRVKSSYPKDHWIDAACVGYSGSKVKLSPKYKPLQIKAMGRKSRQMVNNDDYGFPKKQTAKSSRKNRKFLTGDYVRIKICKGPNEGIHKGRVSSGGAKKVDVQTGSKTVGTTNYSNIKLLEKLNGYAYSR